MFSRDMSKSNLAWMRDFLESVSDVVLRVSYLKEFKKAIFISVDNEKKYYLSIRYSSRQFGEKP